MPISYHFEISTHALETSLPLINDFFAMMDVDHDPGVYNAIPGYPSVPIG
jgi:hypothetical protein